MRLSQLASLSLFSLGLVTRHAVANPLPLALAEALAEPVPQNCPVPCGSNLCCAATQYCAVSGSQCGEGTGPNTANGNFLVWTSTFVTTRVDTNVQTIVSVYSSLINPSVSSGYVTATWTAPTVTGSNPSSGGVYPTLTASVSGSNTFLVPIPTASASSNTTFGYGGIIGTNSTPQGLSSAQIGGIVGGILGAFFLIALILICCCMRRGFNGFFGWMNSWGHQGETTVVHSGSSGHGHGSHTGLAAATAGGLGYLFGRKTGHHGSSTSQHVVSGHSGHQSSGMKKTGMAALLGGAAAGLASLFASRRKERTSEKYSTTDTSGYYTSDITDSTSYTATSSSESSSSSSSSSSSGHPHHGRR